MTDDEQPDTDTTAIFRHRIRQHRTDGGDMSTTPALVRADARLHPLLPDQPETRMDFTRLAVSAALHDPDDDVIARTLAQHQIVPEASMQCSCDRWPYDEHDDLTPAGFAMHQADVVRAAILGSGVSRG